jgi:type IX secretion system PorP/SprF family membrane protein
MFKTITHTTMKKLIIISAMLTISAAIFGQQFPFMEGYTNNPFALSPSYAGVSNTRMLFVDYRSDWSGISGGPKTIQLSYNDKIYEKVGVGGKFIYDKTDIFKQTLLMGSYTYQVTIGRNQFINFGLSAGLYKNSIDLAKYYNDPSYVQDAVLVYGLEKSKIKFATDFSALYRVAGFEGGFLFSNVMFGSAKYNAADISYKPMKNYLLNFSYRFDLNKNWMVKPFILVRGGEHIPAQLELTCNAAFREKFWGTLTYRTGGVYGFGFGSEIMNGVLLNYSYNLSSNVAMNTFGSHQLTLGIKLFKSNIKKETGEGQITENQ